MAQQTAVEYLFMMLANHNILNHKVLADNKHLTELTYRIKTDAKQMEKEQKMHAFTDCANYASECLDKNLVVDFLGRFKQYYNETYGNEGV